MALNYILDLGSAFHRNGEFARSIPIIRMTKEGVGTKGEN